MARRKPSKKPTPAGNKKKGSVRRTAGDKLGKLAELIENIGELDPESLLELVEGLERNATSMVDVVMPPGHKEARDLVDLVDPIESPELARQAAKKALKICPQFMEAYMLMAELETNSDKVVELYHQAIEAGNWMLTALDSLDLEENPILVANLNFRLGMADHLWNLGQRAESIDLMMSVIPLDEHDELDSRWSLVFRLMEADWIDELEIVRESLRADTHDVAVNLTDALICYQEHGDIDAARSSLQIAHRVNPHLMDYLIGDVPFVQNDSPPFPVGGVEEAAWLAAIALPVVRKISGASRWMRDTLNYQRPERPAHRRGRKEELAELLDLPQEDEIWIVDYRRLNDRCWMAVIFDAQNGDVLRMESTDSKPSSAVIWDWLAETFVSPEEGGSRRPTELRISKKSLASAWQGRCNQLDIACIADEKASIPDDVFDSFADLMDRVECRIDVDENTLQQVRELPQIDSAWIVGVFQPPLWITDEATPRRPYIAVVLEAETGCMLMQDMAGTVSPDFLTNAVFKAILQPMGDQVPSVRPSEVRLHHKSEPGTLAQRLHEVDVACFETDSTEVIDECMEMLLRHCGTDESSTAMLDCDGVSPSDLAGFYQSLARFYRASLWRSVPGDQAIELSSPLFRDKAWYAVIVGQLGMHLGLVLYHTRESLDRVFATRGENHDPDALFLNYTEAFEIPPMDLWFIEKHQWPIAGEEAYPQIDRYLPGRHCQRPNRAELIALDVAVRTLPALVSRPDSDDCVSIPITTFGESTEVKLRWLR